MIYSPLVTLKLYGPERAGPLSCPGADESEPGERKPQEPPKLKTTSTNVTTSTGSLLSKVGW